MERDLANLITARGPSTAGAEGALRQQRVELNRDLITSLSKRAAERQTDDLQLRPQEEIRFNLFEQGDDPAIFFGLVHQAYFKSEETVVAKGELVDQTGGTFTIVIHKGHVGVEVFAATGNFDVSPVGDGYVVQQLDPNTAFRCEPVDPYSETESTEPDDSQPDGTGGNSVWERADSSAVEEYLDREIRRREEASEPASNERLEDERRSPEAVAEERTRVDVLLVYTPAAREVAGGLARLELLVQQQEDFLNDAFFNSLPDVRPPLRARFLSLQEVPNSVAGTLATLRTSSIVRDFRDRQKADIVVLLRRYGRLAGRAYVVCNLSSADYYSTRAFAYVRVDAIRRYNTIAHEIGHLFGCNHNPGAPQPDCNLFGDSYGHYFRARDPNGVLRGYGTIMSYPYATNRVRHFSNPDVAYRGVPTGRGDRDNARAIRATRFQLSRYRISDEVDVGGPEIELLGPADGHVVEPTSEVNIRARVRDPNGISRVGLYWQRHNLHLWCGSSGSWWSCEPLGNDADGWSVFEWTVRLGTNTDRRIYHVRATDSLNNSNSSSDRHLCVTTC